MGDLVGRLRAAIDEGDGEAVQAALAAGADPDTYYESAYHEGAGHALVRACSRGRLACVEALLQAGADPNAARDNGYAALHAAASGLHPGCIARLLAAGADPLHADQDGWTALHWAMSSGPPWPSSAGAVKLLLQAAPQAASMKDCHGRTPMEHALGHGRYDEARCLLQLQPALPPAAEVLAALEAAGTRVLFQARPLPDDLHAILATRQPLTPAEWMRMPASCEALATALPAVLRRSTAEAAQLVRHLPEHSQRRLRTAVLCLRRMERRHGLELPPELTHRLLLAALE